MTESEQRTSGGPDDLMDVKEAAEYVGGVSHHTFYKWASAGQVPCERRGRRLFFTRRGLDAWRKAQQHGGH
ncbi:helix-turn-helix domain-containing protein [Corallococcus exiguus]|uniref:helix-turn-helix domain-containing protein n=1 Tax=Corallococcus sp. AB030 TaxID=2316716 RepID=UPI000EDBC167|nr:helix-turn-helix domain-containing protein [Corallococcus sp. AB030]NNC01945.1 helix-turn-helix domain-containing protein [Corallococcus exiguus]RKI18634.1 DNA-binding protein [Corallococcus sp. AB030]